MASVVALLAPQADSKNLYLRSVAEPLGWLEIDPVRLRQCLFNVIGNAVKFTETGGVEVRMSLVGEGAERKLRCEVQDTGVGVPEDAKPRCSTASSRPTRVRRASSAARASAWPSRAVWRG